MSLSAASTSAWPALARMERLPWVLMAAAIAAALTWQFTTGLNPDSTWLMVVTERWLAGERLYVDLLENNPPASMFLYAPPVFLARLLGLGSEVSIQLWFFILAGFSFVSARLMLLRSGYGRDLHLPWLGFCVCAIFLLMPAATFAQREHAAALLALPVAALAAIRTSGVQPRGWMIIAAGLAAGVVAAIKPPMIAVVVLVSMAASLHRRDWRILLAAENWIGAAVFLTYGALVYVNHPEFLDIILPLLNDVYIHSSFLINVIILKTFYVIVFLLAHIWVVHRGDMIRPPASLVFAAAMGFLISYFVQQKFFDYHAMPVSIYLLLSLCIVLCRRGRAETSATPAAGVRKPDWEFFVSIAVAVMCGSWNFYLYYGGYYRGALTQAIKTIAPAPSALAMTTHLGPYMREVRLAGGRWAGSFGQTFVPGFNGWYRDNVTVSAEWEKRLSHWEQWTVDNLEQDIVNKKPDLVIIVDEHDFDWQAWFRSKPQLNKAMAHYRLAHTVRFANGIYPLILYVRKKVASGAPAPSPKPASAAQHR